MIIKYLFYFLIFIPTLFAEINTKYSAYKCLQLPILGRADDIELFEVYQRVEEYLKKTDWCYYQSNSSILTMLQKQGPNLDLYLENANVLRDVADRTKSGSLIRIKVHSVMDGLELKMEVIGDNGQDIFFKEKMTVQEKSVEAISQVVINWLEIYEKTIPYDGRVLGVAENQFTIDLGKSSGISIGHEVRVERPMEKKHHPLLKEVVEWRTNLLGKGRVIKISEFQSLVGITKYTTYQQFRSGDWVIINEDSQQQK